MFKTFIHAVIVVWISIITTFRHSKAYSGLASSKWWRKQKYLGGNHPYA